MNNLVEPELFEMGDLGEPRFELLTHQSETELNFIYREDADSITGDESSGAALSPQ